MTGQTSRVVSRTIREARFIRGTIASGCYIAASGVEVDVTGLVAQMVAGTSICEPGEPTQDARDPEVTVEAVGSVTAVFEASVDGGRIGVLNFASGTHRGGGFDLGSTAQEEDVCRSSLLVAALDSSNAAPFYDRHVSSGPVGSDVALFSPRVPFIRSGPALVDIPILADVFTLAAPRAYAVDATTLRRRLATALCSKQMAGIDTLVLGAWGCGEYGNDPDAVAEAFRVVLDEAVACRRVRFAISDRSAEQHNLRAFARVLSGGELITRQSTPDRPTR